MRHKVSPIPIHLTPGHLSSAINLQATNASRPLGSKEVVQILLAKETIASHRSAECEQNDVHDLFHPSVSIPEGPAAPSIFMTTLQMKGPSI